MLAWRFLHIAILVKERISNALRLKHTLDSQHVKSLVIHIRVTLQPSRLVNDKTEESLFSMLFQLVKLGLQYALKPTDSGENVSSQMLVVTFSMQSSVVYRLGMPHYGETLDSHVLLIPLRAGLLQCL
jgi:hypothetical protein